jgi:tetratricopeptide (TPR) repeat protein
MPGIFYHNAQDILSLVTLMARQCGLLSAPLPAEEEAPGEDLYGLGRLLYDLGEAERAEAAYAQAAETCRVPDVQEQAMRDLAYLLKRQERRAEALPWWQRLVETAGTVYACEELAKHYEWHDEDLAQALAWTERGMGLVESWPAGYKQQETMAELEHRLARLERKSSESEMGTGAVP